MLHGLTAQSFSLSSLKGEFLNSPTSLQFGPDGRLYVAQQNGLLLAYSIQRNSSVDYQVTGTEVINNIQQIENHNDDGTLDFDPKSKDKRQVTGILVTGTANNVIIYVGSSDSRIGGGSSKGDVNLDTNSGMISRLTKSGGSWQRLDLVRGLPRSEENHANNGMQIKGNLLYVAQGGNTNAGAPSNNFAFITEYALSGAILTVNLAVIDALPTKTASDGSQYKYDIPTLDDPTRPNQNGQDVGDPFGGNDGLNQAKWVAGGPVQVYAGGFRNIYDLVWTTDNKLYTWDNGPNGGWGGHPANEGFGTATNNWIAGEPGSSTNGPNDGPVNNKDGLHFVNGSNYYGGHPNPIRANPNGAGLFTHDASLSQGGSAGVWRTSKNGPNPLPMDWPPVPASLANPTEGDYQNPGVNDPSIFTVTNSTNGLVEYTASNFDNTMKGNLIAASFKGPLYRVQRNASGGINSTSSVTTLANNFGSLPLDVTTQGDNDPFPGTIWVATLGDDKISILEPQDFGGCSNGNSSQDEDGDSYTNVDELANGTDPCNAADLPADFDKTFINGFLVSNLNDPDDDDDGLLDAVDPFVWDPQNGSSTNIPVNYPLLNADPGFGFFGLGFTGLMSNGSTDYLNLIQDEDNSGTEIIAGGAVGLLTFNNVPKGDPYTNNNTQQNGFQFGLNVNQNTQPFVYEASLLGPIFISTPQQYQSAGIFIGTGDQSNYFKAVINGNGPTTGIQILYEEANAIVDNQQVNINNIGYESDIRLLMKVTPSSGQVQVQYAIGNGTPQDIGQPVSLQGNVLSALQSSNQSLAIGIISTAINSTSTFNATWDNLSVEYLDNTSPPASTLITSTNSLNFTASNTTQNVTLTNSNGPQGILIQSLNTNNATFNASISQGLPFNLMPSASVNVAVNFSSGNDESGQLTIQHTGNNGPTTTVKLMANTSSSGGGETVTESCNGHTIEHGNGTIKLISDGSASFFKVLDENWQFINSCGWNCGGSFTVNNLAAGKYRVFFENSNYQTICDKLITLGGGGGGNSDPDNDNDGVPASQDCNDNDPNLTTVGASCNDGNPNTNNDVVQANCTCTGTPSSGGGGGNTVTESCSGNTIEHGNGTIRLISNGSASFFKVLDENWQYIDNCGWNCGNSFTVNNLAAGKYRVFFEDSNYQPVCDKLITLGGGGGGNNDPDNDNDGVPASQDCNDNDSNLTTVGASCNDGNPNTNNDVVQANCTCAGTPSGGGGGNTVTESCNGNTIEHGNGTIKMISGGSASFFQIADGNWSPVDHCGWNCGNTFEVNNLAAGRYLVNFQDANYNSICEKWIEITGSNNATASAGNRITRHLSLATYASEQAVDLQWATNTGFLNDYFEVEKSTDGQHFTTIQTVKNKELGSEMIVHQLTDEAPEVGTNYYRIKQIYRNQSFTYSEVRAVNFAFDVHNWTIFPNPTKGTLHVNLVKYKDQPVTLQLTNVNGSVMLYRQFDAAHDNSVLLDLSTFDNGFYLLHTQAAGHRLRSEKVMILRGY